LEIELSVHTEGSYHQFTTDWLKQFHLKLKESSLPAEVNKDP